MLVPCLNIMLLIPLAWSAEATEMKQVRLHLSSQKSLTFFFHSPFTNKNRCVQLSTIENTARQMTDFSEFDLMLKASLKKLAKKDQEIQSILRDSQGQSLNALSAASVRSAVLACVTSDDTVFAKIRMKTRFHSTYRHMLNRRETCWNRLWWVAETRQLRSKSLQRGCWAKQSSKGGIIYYFNVYLTDNT